MISAGIDAGAENTKAAIVDGERLLAWAVLPSGSNTQAAVRIVFKEALEKARITENEVICTGSTGMGGRHTGLTSIYITDLTSNARGALWLWPSARTVIDMGAEQSQAMILDDKGIIIRYARNDQCAAGAGAFITEMASVLEMSMEELSQASLLSKNTLKINSTCTIFAESEVISLVNEGHDKNDIARAVCDTIASKGASLARELNITEDVVFIGGIAHNTSVSKLLKEKMGREIIVPKEPRIVAAIGAAIAARRKQY
jgi:(R)-2-hydroxyacyl-CoA dehydratese activating ATPase